MSYDTNSVTTRLFFISTFINLLTCDPPVIDPNHLKNNPNCGEVPEKMESRIANAKESDVHYPWVINVVREFKKEVIYMCGGAIINQRYYFCAVMIPVFQ